MGGRIDRRRVLTAVGAAATITFGVLLGAGPAHAAASDDDRTPAVTSGGVFSDARDWALSLATISPAVSADGVYSDARDTARGGR